VTNRSVFSNSPKNNVRVEIFYAGQGIVHFDSSGVETLPPGELKRVGEAILISTVDIDRWWWANISVNFSTFKLAEVNASTLRLYWYDSSNWTPAERTGLDLPNNVTANVTVLGNFTVVGLPPINHRPQARLGKDITIMEGETVLFNASGSSDSDNDFLKFCWTFGDSPGKAPVPGDKTAEHKYTKPGRYTVTVYVSDDRLIGNATQEVIVKQKGGEQFVIVIVVIIVLVVAIIFILPRGEKEGSVKWRDEEEFKKGMAVKKKKGKPGKKGGGPPGKEEEE